jgi:hypothetical protein
VPNLLEERLVDANSATVGGHRINRATFERWRTRGVRLPNGGRAVLETVRVGGRRYTSAEAVERFVDRTNTGAVSPSVMRPGALRRAHDRAEDELAAVGA